MYRKQFTKKKNNNKFRNKTSVVLANFASHLGTKYCIGMILSQGSTTGLPDFVLIHQTMVVKTLWG